MASTVVTRNSSWVTARTWVTGELITASIMNAHVRDQLNALKQPAYFLCTLDEASDLSITANTTFTDVDSDLTATVTCGGGFWLVGFTGNSVYSAGVATKVFFTIAIDTTNQAGDDGYMIGGLPSTATAINVSFQTILPNAPAAGSHTFRMRWKTGATGTYILYSGAGTSGFDIHPTFWGIELV